MLIPIQINIIALKILQFAHITTYSYSCSLSHFDALGNALLTFSTNAKKSALEGQCGVIQTLDGKKFLNHVWNHTFFSSLKFHGLVFITLPTH